MDATVGKIRALCVLGASPGACDHGIPGAGYPDIDVTTTTEVHAQLVAHGAADHVTSGVSEVVLQQKVEVAVAAGHHHLDAGDLVPSSIGLAVIALLSFMDKSLSLEQKGAEFGDRGSQSRCYRCGCQDCADCDQYMVARTCGWCRITLAWFVWWQQATAIRGPPARS